MDARDVGKFIASLRTEKGYTQQELADKLNISNKTVSKLETGRGLPDSSLLIPLGEALGVSVGEILSAEKVNEKEAANKSGEVIVDVLTATKKRIYKTWVCTALIFAVLIGGFAVWNNTGVYKNNIEQDARSSQNIDDDWIVLQNSSDEIYAMLFYPNEKDDHTFSIYINRKGFSFGYYFASGGSSWGVSGMVRKYDFEYADIDDVVYISNNQEKATSYQLTDGERIIITPLNGEEPFVIIESGDWEISFYNDNGELVYA